MKDLFFFDADCRIGSSAVSGVGPGVKELIAHMDYSGVDRALVRHTNINMLGAVESNIEIARMLKEDTSGRLTGMWTILPSQCDELPEPDEFFRQMKENRIGALTLSPFEHRYVPCRLTLGRIMDAARERKVPVFTNVFSGKWKDLYDFIKEFPENIFVHCDPTGKWGHDRQIRPLLENYANFYFGMTGYKVPEGVRDIAEKYGAEKMIYSSGYPFYQEGCGMLQLKHSGLSDADIEKIAGKNLENLLKGAQL